MDISSVSTFDFSDQDMRQHFLMLNGMAHQTYYLVLLDLGYNPSNYPVLDLSDTEIGHKDWLQIHALTHQQENDLLNLGNPDLTDCDFNDANDFASWLQLHQDAHIAIDQALGV